jgi:hypothetical protein
MIKREFAACVPPHVKSDVRNLNGREMRPSVASVLRGRESGNLHGERTRASAVSYVQKTTVFQPLKCVKKLCAKIKFHEVWHPLPGYNQIL